MHAVRLHYRPVRYLTTRWLSRRVPTWGTGPLGFVDLDDIEPPTLPGPDWVRVETSLSGICGSDLAAITAHDSFTLEPFTSFPFTFGHENVGRIAEVGAAVDDWKAGDNVVINPMLSCVQRGYTDGHACAACARGEDGLCRRTADGDGALGGGPMVGYCPAVGGGWSRTFVAHSSRLHAAGGLPDEVAVLADPFVSALRPVLLHPPREGDVVLVIGAGTIGALTVRALRLTGWKGTIAVQARYPAQRELAERAGADRIFARGDEVYAWAESLPGAKSYDPSLAAKFVDGGPSLIYDTVGSQGTIRGALAIAREGGRIVLVGSAARVSADWTRVWYRQLEVAGVFAYGRAPFEGAKRDIYDIALELMRRDDFARLNMLTHVFELEDYRAAIAAALDKDGHGSIKVAFRPGGR